MKDLLLVTTRGRTKKLFSGQYEERDNVRGTAGHTSCGVSHFAIVIPKKTLTQELITSSGAFVVNFVRPEDIHLIDACNALGGKYTNKFAQLGLQCVDAVKVDAARLQNAIRTIECSVVGHIDCGEQDLFVGRILYDKSYNRYH